MQRRSIFILPAVIIFFWIMPLHAQDDSTADSIKQREYPLIPREAINDALSGIKITANDIGFRTDYVEIDSFRLPLINSLTRNPLGMAERTKQFAKDFLNDSVDATDYFMKTAPIILKASGNPDFFLSEMLFFTSNENPITGSTFVSQPDIDYPENISNIDIISLDRVFTQIYDFLYDWTYANQLSDSTRASMKYPAGLNKEEYTFLRDSFPILIRENEMDEFRPLKELDSLQKFEEELSKRAIPICKKIRITSLLRKQPAYICEFERFVVKMRLDNIDYRSLFDSKDWHVEKETLRGKIAVGGWGENQYEGEYLFILDFGGNDRYLMDHNDSMQVI
ncbi:MAG: hypothetical protein GF310_00790, partial [candidate division Zixibacteria bacterium]|nr:hypothetical protein [candidate division Zixibacteria bacterium]